MKTKEVSYNFLLSIGSNIIVLIMGLVIPRLILVNYGSDTNGFIGTLTQIFTYLTLLEAGISQATLNSLYRPIKEKNNKATNEVLSAARKYYRRIARYYALCVIALAFLLPTVIHTELSYSTVFLCVLFEGASNVVLFYFVQTETVFLIAEGKTYVKSLIELLNRILGYGIKIVLALFAINIVCLEIGYFFLSLLKILMYKRYMRTHYECISYSQSIEEKQILLDRGAYVLTEVAWTIFSATDLIVLSIFTSTKLSSVYSINNMPFVAINGFVNAAYNGIYYLLGRNYVQGIKQYEKIHDLFNSLFLGMVTVLMIVAVFLADPFIKLYTSGVEDVSYSYHWLPVMFAMVQMLSWSRYVAGNLTGIAGYAKQVGWISLMEAGVNIVCSLILVHFWGIYGVVFATVIALPLKVIYTNYLAEKKIMKRKPTKTLRIFAVNYGAFIASVFLRDILHYEINSYVDFVKAGCTNVVSVMILMIALNCLANRDVMIILLNHFKGRKNENR